MNGNLEFEAIHDSRMWPSKRLQTLLKIEHPIVQAPMGGATSPELTAAVSNEGGFGMVAGISCSAGRVSELIRETKALTSKPFGVNLVFKDDVDPLLDAALEEGVSAVSFFWGDPVEQIERVHDAGSLVMLTVSCVEEAKKAVDIGVDVIVAQGSEAGGHVPGSVSTLVLVPAITNEILNVPVLAAGGLSSGASIVAAFALGASGAWVGTRFLGAREASIHSVYRDHLIDADETSKVYSQLFNKGWECPHRTLRNSTTKRWEQAGRPQPGSRPGETDVVATKPDGTNIERYTSATPNIAFEGEIEALPMWAGQGVYSVREIEPASVIFRRLVAESRARFLALTSTD